LRIGIVGAGKLGLPVALAIESKNHEVFVHDIREDHVKQILRKREYSNVEQGAQELLQKSRIKFLPLNELILHCDIVFVAIQTPHDIRYEGITRLQKDNKDFDYTFLKNGVKAIADESENQKKETILVIISTVLPQTIKKEIRPLLNDYTKLVYNPYFIAMGTTIRDFLHPEFILFGTDEQDDVSAIQFVQTFYRTITEAPIL